MIKQFFDLGFFNTPHAIEVYLDLKSPKAKKKVSGSYFAISAIVIVLIVASTVTAILSRFQTLLIRTLPDVTKSLDNARGLKPALLAIVALVGLAFLLGIMAFFLYLLRRLANPLYWQLACWFLISVGILLRPIVAAGADPLQTTIKGALLAGLVSLGVFPVLMRLLNRLKPEPGLMHVALPFALGFFLDVAQVMAKTYVPGFSWLR